MNLEKCPCLSLLNSYAERTIDLIATYDIKARGERMKLLNDDEIGCVTCSRYIASYEGKLDLQENESKVLFDLDGKRYVYYNAVVEVIEK